MRKIILLCVLAIGMIAGAQTVQTIAKPLKLNIVTAGTAADSVLVRGADKIVKFVPSSKLKSLQVNADWNAISGAAMILNKPIIPTVVPQVNTDWNSISGVSQILNKPQFRTINGQSIFGSTDLTISGGTSIAHLEFDNTSKTIWNNGGNDVPTNLTIGSNSLTTATGGYNTAYGNFSLSSLTTPNANTAIGYQSLRRLQNGGWNSVVGFSAMEYNQGGSRNTALGEGAGATYGASFTSLLNPNESVFIGSGSRALLDNQTNEIVIGYNAIGAGSNTVTLGNNTIIKTILRGQVEGNSFKINTLNTSPSSPTDLGTVGEIRITSTHIYWCIATNTWIRAAGSTW